MVDFCIILFKDKIRRPRIVHQIRFLVEGKSFNLTIIKNIKKYNGTISIFNEKYFDPKHFVIP